MYVIFVGRRRSNTSCISIQPAIMIKASICKPTVKITISSPIIVIS